LSFQGADTVFSIKASKTHESKTKIGVERLIFDRKICRECCPEGKSVLKKRAAARRNPCGFFGVWDEDPTSSVRMWIATCPACDYDFKMLQEN